MRFITEKDSIDFICDYFRSKDFIAKPTQDDDQYCHYDIEIVKGGKKIWLELKRRNFPSWQYGDAVIEKDKYNYFIKSKEEQLVDGVIVITLFTDCFTMSNALKPIEFFEKKASHHTEFNDKRMVTKHFVKYKFEFIKHYEEI